MKKTILVLFFLSAIFSLTFSQFPDKQAGLRTGVRGGLFYQVTGESGNAETGYLAMLGFNNNGLQITGLRVIYATPLSEISPDLYFAWGYGGHAGFILTNNVRFMGDRYYFRSERFCPLFGVDGWGAIEYRIRSVPIIISLNIKPYVELTIPSFLNIMPGDLGISVSYFFK
jgi:hypothetical protein